MSRSHGIRVRRRSGQGRGRAGQPIGPKEADRFEQRLTHHGIGISPTGIAIEPADAVRGHQLHAGIRAVPTTGSPMPTLRWPWRSTALDYVVACGIRRRTALRLQLVCHSLQQRFAASHLCTATSGGVLTSLRDLGPPAMATGKNRGPPRSGMCAPVLHFVRNPCQHFRDGGDRCRRAPPRRPPRTCTAMALRRDRVRVQPWSGWPAARSPVFYTFAGPQSIKGGLNSSSASARYPSDLLGAIVPSIQWLTTRGPTATANTRFSYAAALYLGLPLVIVLASFAVLFRKRRTIPFAGMMALIAFVLSLGPRLRVDGHDTPIRLPFVIFDHLPVVENFVQVRFSLYTALFAAAMFSIGLEELWQRLRRSRSLRRLSRRWRVMAAAGLSAAIAAAMAIPLVPGNTQPASSTDIPSFFTSTAVDAIPQGSVVLAYPYPDFSGPSLFYQPSHGIMLDQAVAGMRFKLIGGYF